MTVGLALKYMLVPHGLSFLDANNKWILSCGMKLTLTIQRRASYYYLLFSTLVLYTFMYIKLYENRLQRALFLVDVCEVMRELTMLTIMLQEPMKHTETGQIIIAQ